MCRIAIRGWTHGEFGRVELLVVRIVPFGKRITEWWAPNANVVISNMEIKRFGWSKRVETDCVPQTVCVCQRSDCLCVYFASIFPVSIFHFDICLCPSPKEITNKTNSDLNACTPTQQRTHSTIWMPSSVRVFKYFTPIFLFRWAL